MIVFLNIYNAIKPLLTIWASEQYPRSKLTRIKRGFNITILYFFNLPINGLYSMRFQKLIGFTEGFTAKEAPVS